MKQMIKKAKNANNSKLSELPIDRSHLRALEIAKQKQRIEELKMVVLKKAEKNIDASIAILLSWMQKR